MVCQTALIGITERYATFNRQFVTIDFSSITDVPLDLPVDMGRYSGQTQVFGSAFQQAIQQMSTLIGGVGAVGCEFVKLVASMGVGKCHMVDMDIIAPSNLVRQPLFDTNDIGKFKSEAAFRVACRLNPNVQWSFANTNVESSMACIPWGTLNFIMSSLDKKDARHFLEDQAHILSVPLFEGNLNGLVSNSIAVIPFVTAGHYEYLVQQKRVECTAKYLVTNLGQIVRNACEILADPKKMCLEPVDLFNELFENWVVECADKYQIYQQDEATKGKMQNINCLGYAKLLPLPFSNLVDADAALLKKSFIHNASLLNKKCSKFNNVCVLLITELGQHIAP